MAMSLELAIYILRYCLWKQPKSLLDLGSGFSSYVFRLYRASTSKSVVVYSVDDNADWMHKTEHYLENAGLNTEHLYLLTELQEQELDGYFDLVLLDLNYVEVRKDYIAYAGKLLSANGAVIVDDVHKVEFLREVKRIATAEKHGLFNIKKTTSDEFGRFAIVMKR
jgi:predicted O-methyltransferase YrrM